MSNIQQELLSDKPGAVPAPVGLGNYKGVMLCNRPDAMKWEKPGPPPFKSTVSETYGQPIGVNPVKELPLYEASGAEVCPAIKKHAEWLKVLQEEMKKHKSSNAAARAAEIAKAAKVKKVAERQREAVRKVMTSQVENVRENLGQAINATDLSNVPIEAKPLWALSHDEMEEFDLMESDKLLNFADGLDFDSYIHDLEFRQALETLQGRAKEIDKEQKVFKEELVAALNEASDDDIGIGDSTPKEERKVATINCSQSDWDQSTTCGDKPEIDQEAKGHVDRVFASNSDIRSVHSKESVKNIIKMQKEKLSEAAKVVKNITNIAETCRPPNPTIVTHDANLKTKDKEVDPSMLPYLYRSPAI
eukprot:GEMP01065579.1.p1 GENE.GEMP01065579.1~~GEMP01065579.1.p1  ORF type:complete len:361 (+),score=66.34 GEMP01065579.1:90-1172(+)